MPAASSAILSFFRPDLFVFMDDEVIECLYDGKREYNLKVYGEINTKCKSIATQLGDDWTPRRVGRALWSAAISSAYSDQEDLTLMETDEDVKSFKSNDTDSIETSKKRRRKR